MNEKIRWKFVEHQLPRAYHLKCLSYLSEEEIESGCRDSAPSKTVLKQIRYEARKVLTPFEDESKSLSEIHSQQQQYCTSMIKGTLQIILSHPRGIILFSKSTVLIYHCFIVACIPTSNNTICFLQTNMVLEVDCQHLWVYMICMKTFCKTQIKDLPLVLYSVIYLRPLILLIMRDFCGSWNISMWLEVYHTNFLFARQTAIYCCWGYRSTTWGVTLGVPQGLSLGPLLFALYANDLPQASNLTPTLFADDTLLTISCANSAYLNYGVNSEPQKVDEWMRYNKLSINYSKNTYMLINSNSSQSWNFKIKIYDSEIKHITCTKYLGVYIDQYLS